MDLLSVLILFLSLVTPDKGVLGSPFNHQSMIGQKEKKNHYGNHHSTKELPSTSHSSGDLFPTDSSSNNQQRQPNLEQRQSILFTNWHDDVPNENSKLSQASTPTVFKRHSTFVKKSSENDVETSKSMHTIGTRNLKSSSIMGENIFNHKSLQNNEESRVEDVIHDTSSRSVQHYDGKAKEMKSNQLTSRKVSGRNQFSSLRSRAMQMPLTAVRFISNYNYDGTDTLFCLKVKNLRVPAKLQIRACDGITDQSNWFYFDSNDYLRLSIDSSKCIRWANTRLFLDNCPLGATNLQRAKFQFNKILRGIEAQKGDNLRQWMIGVDPTDRFELVRLFLRNGKRDNKSCYAWEMDYASESPSLSPTSSPSVSPSAKPSSKPSSRPSVKPSSEPSLRPSSSPSVTPTAEPSMRPSASPTSTPSSSPSSEPSLLPSDEPSLLPSSMPSDIPSDVPSDVPSDIPSDQPSLLPSSMPSDIPSDMPSDVPSDVPSDQPSLLPSSMPSDIPSDMPSDVPSDVPSDQPSLLPSAGPSSLPTTEPSVIPSSEPSTFPSDEPSTIPSDSPSSLPSSSPSDSPSECRDEPGWRVGGESDYAGMTCSQVESEQLWCAAIWALKDHDYNGKGIKEACCYCGGSKFFSTYPSRAPSSKPSISSRPTVISESPSGAPSSQPSVCIDEPNWIFESENGLGCDAINEQPETYCQQFSDIWYKDKNTYLACCACGGGLHQSVAPSFVPTSTPSTLPSSTPTLSFIPTQDITSSPSWQPSVSMAPTNFPSLPDNTVFDTDTCNYDSECRGTSVCNNKVCEQPSVSRKERTLEGENEISYGRKRNLDVDVFVLDVRDFSKDNKPVNYHTSASFVQGGLETDVNDREKFTLIGNAWKAYPLPHPFYITRDTRLKFELSIEEVAQGHAICIDSDAILSDSRKCIWLSGNKFNRHDAFDAESSDYSLCRAKIANLALGMPSMQSSTSHFGISDARKAVDGYINPRWSESLDIEKNSIAITNNEANAFWEVSLSSLKTISEIVIHESKMHLLGPFRVVISTSGPSGTTITSKIFESNDNDSVFYGNNVYKIIMNEIVQGEKVRIELLEEGVLALVEVLVLGEDPGVALREYDIQIGEMIMDDVSFGHPIWKGIKVDLKDDGDYTLPSSTDGHVRLRASHIFTDVLGSSDTDCTIVVHKDSDRAIFSLTITPSNGFFHTELPPGIVGSEVEFLGCSPTKVQVFGNAEIIEAGSAFDGSRPTINYIALIQNSPTVDDVLVGKSTFKSVQLYNDVKEISVKETAKFLPFKVNGQETLSAVSYGNFGAFKQDFAGEVYMSTDNGSATLKGNAWKAFKLSVPHAVTEHTRLKFNFFLKNEAEGHAICVEDDLKEDPFAGKHVRCVLVGGSQYNKWSHVKKENLALRATTWQSQDIPNDTRGYASNAVDGNMNTFTNTGIPNSTKTDFFVEIQAGFTITELKIYNRMDSFATRFNNFKVYVKTMSGTVLYSIDLDKSSVDVSGLVHIKDIELNENEIPGNEKLKVGIELNNVDGSTGFPHMIGEFQVFGKPIHDRVTSFDIHVTDLFPETDSKIVYIALIQDNDENQFLGESTFSQIEIVDVSQTLNAFRRPYQTGVDNDPASPRSHVNFGSLDVPQPGESWDTTKSKYPQREDGWDILLDELEDPKDFCFFTEVQTAGYNSKNPKKTDLNDFWKNLGIVSPSRVRANGGRKHCREGFMSFGPTFEFKPLKCTLNILAKKKESENFLRCQGHCNTDDDCAEGLHCFINKLGGQNTSAKPSDCDGNVISGKNYCVKSPSYKADYEEGSETSNLKQCEGDCNSDNDCGPGLRCFQRNGYTERTVHNWNNPHCDTLTNQCYDSTYYDCNPYECGDGYSCHPCWDCACVLFWCDTCCTTCYDTCYEQCETRHYYKINCPQCKKEWQEIATTAERGPDSCAGQVMGGYDYCYNPNFDLTYSDICIDGVTFEDPNTEFPKFMRTKGYGSPYGEVIGKSVGSLKCTNDGEEAKFQNFLCDDKTGPMYYKGTTRTMEAPNLWPNPNQFKDVLRERVRELYPAPVDEMQVENAVNVIFSNHVNYESQYNNKLNGIANGREEYRCPQRQQDETIRHRNYDCYPKGTDPYLVFSYNSPFIEDYGDLFGQLPQNVQDQNAFGFVLTGEVGAVDGVSDSGKFPKYIKPGDDVTINLKKKCYEATIIFDSNNFHIGESLPLVTGLGPLPESCKKTLRCSVHWCGDDPTFTLEAQSNQAFKFRVESHQKGITTPVPFTFEGSNPYANGLSPDYCLQKTINVAYCKKSITWTAPALNNPRSAYTTRLAIVLAENSDTTMKEECFKFPFEWNFNNWQEKRDKDPTIGHSVLEYFSPSFKPPAVITERNSVLLVDIAHDVGGGLAVYKNTKTNKYVTQVCNPQVNFHTDATGSEEIQDDRKQNFYMQITEQSNVPKAVVISDSGTVAMVHDGGSTFKVYVFDLVKAHWVQPTVIAQPTSGTTFRIALSTHGHFFAMLTSGKVYLYQKELLGSDYERRDFDGSDYLAVGANYDQVSIHASESGFVSLQARDSILDSSTSYARITREIHFVCADTNSIFAEGGCVCKEGYVLKNKNGVLKKYLTADEEDVCTPEIHVDMMTVLDRSATLPLDKNATYDHKHFITSKTEGDEIVTQGIKLEKRGADGSFNILKINEAYRTKVEHANSSSSNDAKVELELLDLQPGQLYILTLQYHDGSMHIRFVTRCTCDDSSDSTGMPINFRTLPQENGRIMFEFNDNSLCENVFAIVRYSAYEEFSQTIGNIVNIASYKVGSDSSCDAAKISPLEKAMDDQRISKLIVGYTYIYCVQAGSDSGPYMPSPYDTRVGSLDLNHSEPNCQPVVIRWEASIDGIITTEPHAGTLPVEGVEIEYQLLSLQLEDLVCNGCTGTEVTTEGGGFQIEFNVEHPYLKGVNYKDEIPIRIKFRKMTEGVTPIPHKFLCNHGEDPCDNRPLYLRHLEFGKVLHIIDATQVLFTGTVYIDDTEYPGARGCGVKNADICLNHLTTSELEEELVCVKTDASGYYEANVVIGSIITSVNIAYHRHEFKQAEHNWSNYRDGLLITADGVFINNDFVDITTSDLVVEVAGGLCNLPVGKSSVTINILGCPWKKTLDWQDAFTKTYKEVPSAVLEVQVTDVRESTPNDDPLKNAEIGLVKEDFATVIRTINLLDTNAMNEELEYLNTEEESRTGDTGTVDAELPSSPFDSSEVKSMEAVRFQYNGHLKMKVTIPTSNTCEETPTGSFDSFHVMDYMTVFTLRIELHHDILGEKCELVDEGYKVQIISNLGMEEGNQGFQTFFWESSNLNTREALAHCSNIAPPPIPDTLQDKEGKIPDDLQKEMEDLQGNSICIMNITHTDLDENGSTTESSKAQVKKNLAAGRPNPFGSYMKQLLINVLGGTEEVTHEASVFIEGLYTKGEGATISLPTHEPIMILRDPPGGASTASYENVVTTAKVISNAIEIHGAGEIEATLSAGADVDVETCAGGGMGAIVLACPEVADADFEASLPIGAGADAAYVNTEEEASHTFSTTWSYETSDEPARAGPESDVFVVPNLSIKYIEVYNVRWDDTKCEFGLIDYTDSNGEVKVGFPVSVVFDVKNTQDSALSFYTRYHLEYVVFPALDKAIGNQKKLLDRVKAGESICCEKTSGSCLHEGEGEERKICNEDDKTFEQSKLDMLEASQTGWNNALKREEETKKGAIKGKQDVSSWFSNKKELENIVEQESDRNDLAINDHTTYLVPDALIASSKPLDSSAQYLDGTDDKESIKKAKRVHIVGDAGAYEMSLTREATHAFTSQNCDANLPMAVEVGAYAALALGGPVLPIAFGASVFGAIISGCDSEIEFSTEIGDIEANGAVFGVAVGAEGGVGFSIQISHSSSITDEKSEETSVTFVLADGDDGDELVIDIYHEPIYGSFVFDLVAGITKCRWEGTPTLMGEDPKLTVIGIPSQFVFPTDQMIFDLETLNIGEYVYSYFYLVQDTTLEVKLDDGGLLDSYGSNLQLYKEQPVQRFVRIFKPQNGYEFDPVQLTLKSVCESDMDYNTRTVSVLLSNSADVHGNPKLKWLEPCPRVEWAGDLRRDRTFLVNTLSNDSSKLKVKLFNPSASKEKKSFNDMTKSNGRLEYVHLFYRKVGDTNWKHAQDKFVQNIDFALESMNEDPFGYVSEFWNIENLADGTYEVTVEARCSSTGGPEDFDYYRESSIVGVIDNSRPEQFGKVLPLKEEVMFGEEMTIIFTEPIDCSFPFKFDVKMTVDDDWENPYYKDKFHIICEGRQIRLQIDHTNTDPELILGKSFKIEVGRVPGGSDQSGVFDVHGNKRYKDTLAVPVPITIERKFADINLKRALTKFTVSKQIENVNCTNDILDIEEKGNQLQSELAILSHFEYKDRFILSDLECDENQSRISAEVEIRPHESSLRRGLLNVDSTGDREVQPTSSGIFKMLQQSFQNELHTNDERRLLSRRSNFEVTKMTIIPSRDDIKKFAATADQIKEETQLLASSSGDVIQNNASFQNFFNEFKRQKEEEKVEHEREREEEIRILKEEIHRLGSGKNMEEMLLIQGLFFILGCTLAGFTVYYAVRRVN